MDGMHLRRCGIEREGLQLPLSSHWRSAIYSRIVSLGGISAEEAYHTHRGDSGTQYKKMI